MAFDKLFDKAKKTADKAKETAAEALDAGAESVIMAKDAAVDMIDVGKGKLQEGMAAVIEETNNIKVILQNRLSYYRYQCNDLCTPEGETSD